MFPCGAFFLIVHSFALSLFCLAFFPFHFPPSSFFLFSSSSSSLSSFFRSFLSCSACLLLSLFSLLLRLLSCSFFVLLSLLSFFFFFFFFLFFVGCARQRWRIAERTEERRSRQRHSRSVDCAHSSSFWFAFDQSQSQRLSSLQCRPYPFWNKRDKKKRRKKKRNANFRKLNHARTAQDKRFQKQTLFYECLSLSSSRYV